MKSTAILAIPSSIGFFAQASLVQLFLEDDVSRAVKGVGKNFEFSAE